MPEKLEATYKIVTPMFIGDAEQKATDISPASIKGALRFWWRALNWGRFSQNNPSDNAEALKQLHQEESRIFGAAASENGGGQGCFRLIIQAKTYNNTKKGSVHPAFKDENQMAPGRYLAYGLMVAFTSRDRETRQILKRAGQLERGCLEEGQSFSIKLLFRNQVDETVINALKALGLLGALGSRSRHGLGSIALYSMEWPDGSFMAPQTKEEYENEIKSLFSLPFSAFTTEPPFSAFWANSRIDLLLLEQNCYKVLSAFGKALLMYRSWGRSKEGESYVLGQPSEARFDDDHSWCKNKGNPKRGETWRDLHPEFHPERVIFGLPHNYGDKSWEKVSSEIYERRSSPLLFHIHSVGDQFIGTSIYLPAQFLPNGEQINAGGRCVAANIDWSILTNFLDGKVGNPATEEDRFPSKEAVLP